MNSILQQPIYRVLPIHRFIEILVDRALVFPCVSKWEDPAEGDVFKKLNKWKMDLGINWDINQICSGWYGNCWSTNQESDALWRIYSQDKLGVKIKVMPEMFHKVLSNVSNYRKYNPGLKYDVFKMMDAISYKEEAEIDDRMKDIVSFRNYIYNAESKDQKANANYIEQVTEDNARAAIFNGLTEKRAAFDYEDEYRIVIMTENVGEILKISIPDINQLFVEVVFDPRSSDEHFESYKKVIQKLGFKNKIERSSLYHKYK